METGKNGQFCHLLVETRTQPIIMIMHQSMLRCRKVVVSNNCQVPTCPLKQVLLAVIIPPDHTSHANTHSQGLDFLFEICY